MGLGCDLLTNINTNVRTYKYLNISIQKITKYILKWFTKCYAIRIMFLALPVFFNHKRSEK